MPVVDQHRKYFGGLGIQPFRCQPPDKDPCLLYIVQTLTQAFGWLSNIMDVYLCSNIFKCQELTNYSYFVPVRQDVFLVDVF
jgi:hypothetical protein